MKRLRIYIVLCLLLLPVGSAVGAQARKGRRPLCHLPSHSRMISANPQAMVYETLETSGQERGIYGCVFGQRRTYFLGEPESGTPEGASGIRLETLSGSMVAYEGGYGLPPDVSTPGTNVWVVIVRDLRSGRVVRRVPTGPNQSSTTVGAGPLVALVVKGDGAVAWIVTTGREPPTFANDFIGKREYKVFAVDKNGTRQLAIGKDIDPESLVLVGSTLYWTQSGMPYLAALN
jgi:hypothetical protein